MKKLELVDDLPELKEGNNFWNCCPLQRDTLPKEDCSEGKPAIEKNKIVGEPSCKWWVNSKQDKYCFWKYVKRVSKADGSMPELSQAELSKLLGWSNTKTHFVLKEAMSELTKLLQHFEFDVELSDLLESHNESTISRDFLEKTSD